MNYILIAKTSLGWFALLTRKIASTHKPGEYWYENGLTIEEVGQLMGGN